MVTLEFIFRTASRGYRRSISRWPSIAAEALIARVLRANRAYARARTPVFRRYSVYVYYAMLLFFQAYESYDARIYMYVIMRNNPTP